VPISEGKHYKTKRNSLQKKRGSLASCNSLSKLYDNSIVDGRTIGEPVLSFSKGSTGVYFTGLYFYRCSVILIHCSCCARNETLAVSGRFYHQWLFIKLLNSDFPIGLSNKEPCSPPVISINWLFWQLEQLSTSCLKVGQVYS